ncbi:uncharacterized protein L969DRAFT_197419 [Mixia osmundae IAM 14324]|uniref:Condensation domain-containing protein n=1 Tax=Mixia osmundae (strain CBS 9802 / IAM 14324 / JCM 22182 / KY 12970) TaxID=764103 RepID=G7DWJ1_MIXOS|nr:uncharacterized protein L969DRAFT_197419 [Mixia osmundae IAM 14324]KEI37352.1 hypothetical protein L969DRAFT_197419 [Mixia osmundae IAM 14324]GAA94951.1 hypothetical protein E5Q_01606 [Mixia osmundae IAM 14324]
MSGGAPPLGDTGLSKLASNPLGSLASAFVPSMPSSSPKPSLDTSVQPNGMTGPASPTASALKSPGTPQRAHSRQVSFNSNQQKPDSPAPGGRRNFKIADPPMRSTRLPGRADSLYAWQTQPDGSVWRKMGPTEVSYYLGARTLPGQEKFAGVNDVSLRINFTTKKRLVSRERVLAIWTKLRLNHPLLAASVTFQDYENIGFKYTTPKTWDDAKASAASAFDLRYERDPEEELSVAFNDTRILSDERSAMLCITSTGPEPSGETADETQDYSLFIIATHYIIDGMAINRFGKEFLMALQDQSSDPLAQYQKPIKPLALSKFPTVVEMLIDTPSEWGKFAWAAAKIDFESSQRKPLGGHSFPKTATPGPRHTKWSELTYSVSDTAKILNNCRKNEVTVSHAAFAVAGLAFAKAQPNLDTRMPIMMDTAMNVRPRPKHLRRPTQGFATVTSGDDFAEPSYVSMAIGYFFIQLPALLPPSLSQDQLFWHRARTARDQTVAAITSQWMGSRAKLMGLEREKRSIAWEKVQEEQRKKKAQEASSAKAAPPPAVIEVKKEGEPAKQISAPTVTSFLLGFSFLGNMDVIFKPDEMPDIAFHSYAGAGRQRAGRIVLYAYTFCGELYFILWQDSAGLDQTVVASFWHHFEEIIRTVMIGS